MRWDLPGQFKSYGFVLLQICNIYVTFHWVRHKILILLILASLAYEHIYTVTPSYSLENEVLMENS